MSLATNLAIADVLLAHKTGLFRVMGEPDRRSLKRLRHSAKALGIDWPKPIPLEQAQAREEIWTPEKEREEKGGLWTPGSD